MTKNLFEINKKEGIGLEEVIISTDTVVADQKPAIITIEDGTDGDYRFRRHMNGEYINLRCKCTLELTLQYLFAVRGKTQRLVTFAAWQEKEEVIFEFIWRVNRR